MQPFYCSRLFKYSAGDRFECTVINYADANGKVPLVSIVIKGDNQCKEPHPIAEDAYKVDYIADEAYEVTLMLQAFADAVNKIPANGIDKCGEVGVTQDLKGKSFAAFGLYRRYGLYRLRPCLYL